MVIRRCKICRRFCDENLVLHCFPTNEETKIKWADFCKIDLADIQPHTRLCSLHFEPSAFCISPKSKGISKRLKRKAVPTIYDTPEYFQSKTLKEYKRKRYKKNSDKLYIYCYLCGLLEKRTHLFRFSTREPDVLEEWLTICGVTDPNFNCRSNKLCFKHFKPEDFCDRTKEDQLFRLKPSAVPSQNLFKKSNSYSLTMMKNELTSSIDYTDFFKSEVQTKSFPCALKKDPLEICTAEVKKIEEEEGEENETLNSSENTRDRSLEAPSRKGKYSQYLNDIKHSDCNGSKEVKMVLEIARKDVACIRIQNRTLLQRNRRLEQKIINMEKKIEQIKNRDNTVKEQPVICLSPFECKIEEEEEFSPDPNFDENELLKKEFEFELE